MPKKSKPKGILAQLIDFYEHLDKQDKEIVGAIALLVFFKLQGFLKPEQLRK